LTPEIATDTHHHDDSNEVAETGHFSLSAPVDQMDSKAMLLSSLSTL
jgi:hypothetical protein